MLKSRAGTRSCLRIGGCARALHELARDEAANWRFAVQEEVRKRLVIHINSGEGWRAITRAWISSSSPIIMRASRRSFHREVGHEAVAAEHAHRVERDLPAGFRGEQFRHARSFPERHHRSPASFFVVALEAIAKRAASTRVAMSASSNLGLLAALQMGLPMWCAVAPADRRLEGGPAHFYSARGHVDRVRLRARSPSSIYGLRRSGRRQLRRAPRRP